MPKTRSHRGVGSNQFADKPPSVNLDQVTTLDLQSFDTDADPMGDAPEPTFALVDTTGAAAPTYFTSRQQALAARENIRGPRHHDWSLQEWSGSPESGQWLPARPVIADPAASGPHIDHYGHEHPTHLARFQQVYPRQAADAVDARITRDSGRDYGPDAVYLRTDGTVAWASRPGGFDHGGSYSETSPLRVGEPISDTNPIMAEHIRAKHGWTLEAELSP